MCCYIAIAGYSSVYYWFTGDMDHQKQSKANSNLRNNPVPTIWVGFPFWQGIPINQLKTIILVMINIGDIYIKQVPWDSHARYKVLTLQLCSSSFNPIITWQDWISSCPRILQSSTATSVSMQTEHYNFSQSRAGPPSRRIPFCFPGS